MIAARTSILICHAVTFQIPHYNYTLLFPRYTCKEIFDARMQRQTCVRRPKNAKEMWCLCLLLHPRRRLLLLRVCFNCTRSGWTSLQRPAFPNNSVSIRPVQPRTVGHLHRGAKCPTNCQEEVKWTGRQSSFVQWYCCGSTQRRTFWVINLGPSPPTKRRTKPPISTDNTFVYVHQYIYRRT